MVRRSTGQFGPRHAGDRPPDADAVASNRPVRSATGACARAPVTTAQGNPGSDVRDTTAAVEVSPADLGAVADPDTRERHATEARRTQETHDPDDVI